MAGQYGVAQMMKVCMLGAEAANVVDGVLNKEGLFGLLKLTDAVAAIGSLDKELFLKELGEVDAEDYAKLYAAVKAKLDLKDDEFEERVETGIDLVYRSAKIGIDTLKMISELFDLWKSLLKPKPVPVVPVPAPA